jgi:hypothetical protein
MAGRVVQSQAAPDALVPDAPEILMAGQQVSRWQWALALPVDSLVHREAADSNSVSEAQALVSNLRVAVRSQQASLRRAQQKLHGAQPQERSRAASALPQQEIALALVPEKQPVALAA